MKNSLIALAVLVLSSVGVQAQIDRSQMPEPGPAPKINLEKPESFTLKNGVKVLVVENHKLPRVSMTLTMDNPPVMEGEKAGVAGLMGSMLGEGTPEIPKDKFNEEIDYLGASINFFSQGASASTLSKYFPRIMELMSKGALNPNFTEEEFKAEKARAIENLKAGEKSVSGNASRIGRALTFGVDHPYGEFTTIESLEALTLQDVKDFYSKNFTPKNAYLVVVGDVETKEVKKLAEKYLKDWKGGTPAPFNFPMPENVAQTQVNFVDFPNAVQSEVMVTNVIDLQKADEDYFPILIANKILGGGGEARLFLNLREDKGYTYGAYSSTSDDKYVGRFTASASVRNAVTDSAVVAFLDELHRIRTEKVSAEELENAKAKYTGDFVMALERPTTIAQYALNIEIDDLPEDFYETYLQKINAVTAEDIQRVAQKYFLADKARIVVVGKGSEVVENLEKLSYNGKKIPVKYFDKDANEIKKPVFKKLVNPGVTAEVVLDKYIDAIGGKEAVAAVKSTSIKASGEIQGRQLDLEMKLTSDGKLAQSLSMGGMVVQKQVFDGTAGYNMAQGQKIPYTEKDVATAKAEAHPFAELVYENPTLEGIEPVNGEDAYVVQVTPDTKNFYSVDSGLKVQSIKTITQGAQSMSIPTQFSDYKAVNGVLFPYTITQSVGPQSLVFKVSEVKVNEGVEAADFQ